MIGERQRTSRGLRFAAADETTVIELELGTDKQLQIAVNEDWLWLSPEETVTVKKWLNKHVKD